MIISLLLGMFVSYTLYLYSIANDTVYTESIIKPNNISVFQTISYRTFSKEQRLNVTLSRKTESINGSSTIQEQIARDINYLEVKPLIEKQALNNTIILYCTDNSYIDLFLNDYYASKLWKYKNLVITCFDRQCYKKLADRNIPVALLNIEGDSSVDLTQAAICHTKEFHRKAQYKLILWDIALSLNIRILYVDSDVILLKDPLYYLNSINGYDIIGQRDHYLCSGFMYMYPTKNTKLAVKRAIKIRPKLRDADDQQGLIAGIRTIRKFKLFLLPSDRFPSGQVFFDNHSYYWDPINEKQLTLHNNFIHGLENKLYRFKEIKMYKLDRNQEYSNPSARYLTIELWGNSNICLNIRI